MPFGSPVNDHPSPLYQNAFDQAIVCRLLLADGRRGLLPPPPYGAGTSFVVVCQGAETSLQQGVETFPGLSQMQLFARRIDLLPHSLRERIAFFRVWCLREIQLAVRSAGVAVVVKCGRASNEPPLRRAAAAANGCANGPCPPFKSDQAVTKVRAA